MRPRMLQVPENLAPPETPSEPKFTPEPQIITSDVILAPPPTGQRSELTITCTSAPVEALQQVPSRATKRTRKSRKNYRYDNEDSSVESTNSCPTNFLQTRKKRSACDVASVQPSVVQTIVDTETRVKPVPKPFPSPIIGEVSPTDPHFRPADQSSSDEQILNKEDM